MTNSITLARRGLAVAGIALIAAAGAHVAMAAGHHSTVLRTSSNATLHRTIVVDTSGRTVYVLSPETTHHLLCTSAQCLKFWPPVTVSSAHGLRAAGVHGRLGTLRRGHSLQLTLDAHPLYRFALDKAPGDAKGQSIHSFGGTWLVVAAGASHATHRAASPAPAPTTSYGY